MKLSDTKIKNAKGKEKPYKLHDGNGLYVLVNPNGKKYFRMKYHFLHKERLLSFGVYPEVSLADARERCFEARKQKASGVDPHHHKQAAKMKALQEAGNTFEQIAREWHEYNKEKWDPKYSKQIIQRLEHDLFPKLGHKPITTITTQDLIQLGRRIQDRGAYEMRCKEYVSRVRCVELTQP